MNVSSNFSPLLRRALLYPDWFRAEESDNGYVLVWHLDGYVFGGHPWALRAGRLERRYLPPDPLD